VIVQIAPVAKKRNSDYLWGIFMFSLLMLCTMAYIFGIIISPLAGTSSIIIISSIVLFIYLIRQILKKDIKLTVPIIIIMIVVGNVRYYSSTKNLLYESFPDKYVTVNGTIISLPSNSNSEYKYKYTLDVDTLEYLDVTYKINKKIMLSSKKSFAYGDTVCARGFLADFDSQTNEFEFDYKNYYKSKGIFARLTAREIEKTGESHSYLPTFLFGKLKYTIYENLTRHFTGDVRAIAIAVCLGNKSFFTKEYKNLLVKTGMLRVLYSPFIHLCFIAILTGIFFKKKKNRDYATLVLLLLYILWESTSPTSLKAAFLIGIVVFKKQVFGFANKADILSFIVFCMTAIEPMLCFNGGFMVSVISTLLLYTSFKPIYNILSRNRFLEKYKLTSLLTIWIIFTFGAMPYCAYYFNGITPYSTLFTPILLPFVFVILILAPILSILPITLLSTAFSGAVAIIRYTTLLVNKLPFNYIMLHTPSAVELLFWLLIWMLFLSIIGSDIKSVKSKTILSAALGLFVCLALDFGINSLSIYFVNVGQGDAGIIHTFGETVLIDGGGSAEYQSNYNVGDSVLLPYLVSHGFTDIDVAILTHYHKDHMQGIITAIENLKINTLILPYSEPKNNKQKEIETLAKEKNIKVEYLNPNDSISFRSGLTMKVINVNNGLIDNHNENNNSLVFEVNYGKFKALFMGDCESEENIFSPTDVDLIKISHHGSINGNSKEFLTRVSPEIAVISVGKNNSYNLPNKETLENLEAVNATILRTDYLGDIRFKISKNGHMHYNSLY